MKKLRFYCVNFILLIITIVISLFVIEILFRAFIKEVTIGSPVYFPSKESDYYGLPFELLPNGEKCKNCDFYFNKLGLRNYEVDVPKPGNIFRIVVLGDSHVFGGVLYSDTIPQQLQRLLNDDSDLRSFLKKDFEVINAGILTFNLRSIYYLYHHKIRQLNPDLVLYIFHTNDLEESIYKPVINNDGQTIFIGFPSQKYAGDSIGIFSEKVDKFLLRNSVFYRYICFVSESLRNKDNGSSFEVIHSHQLGFLERLYSETKEDKSLFAVSALLKLNAMSSCNPDDFEKEVMKLFTNRVFRLNIPMIDISDTLCGIPVEKLDRGDHAHFSGYANSIISKRLYSGIKNLLISND